MNTPFTGRLTGRIALITGAARGQGAAHARRLASEGAAVVLGDVLDDDGYSVEKDLLADGFDAAYLHLDVADPASWASAHAVISARFDRLDILVNNAGIIHVTDIEDETLEAWNQLLSVNLTGAFLGLQTMLPLLRKGVHAAVVNTSSTKGPRTSCATVRSRPRCLAL